MNSPITATPDSIRSEAASEEPRCPNCREPLLGEFCYACGQPKKGFIRHLSGIIGDFLDTVFNIDSRTLRTVFPLFFRPGFLSLEYFEGRRVRYVTPLRLYFFFSVLAFLAVSWIAHFNKSGDSVIEFNENSPRLQDPKEIEKKRQEALNGLEKGRPFMGEEAFKEASTAINETFDATLKETSKKAAAKTTKTEPTKTETTKSETKAKTETPEKINPNDPNPLRISFGGDTPWDPIKNPLKFDALNEAGNAWLNQLAARISKNVRIAKDDPNRFLAKIFSLAPQTLFVMLPLFALMLKFFYVFKRRLYMEHLIVALHSHSFLCFSILLLVGINALEGMLATASMWQSVLGFFEVVLYCWIPIYLLIAQKRIYKQGWIMTLIKYSMIGFAYTFLISFGVAVNMMLSLASL